MEYGSGTVRLLAYRPMPAPVGTAGVPTATRATVTVCVLQPSLLSRVRLSKTLDLDLDLVEPSLIIITGAYTY